MGWGWGRGKTRLESGKESGGWVACGKEGRRARRAARAPRLFAGRRGGTEGGARADFVWKARPMPERTTRGWSQAACGLEGGAESSSRGARGARAALGTPGRGRCPGARLRAVRRRGRGAGPRAARRRCEAVKPASRASRACVDVEASKFLSYVISALEFTWSFSITLN